MTIKIECIFSKDGLARVRNNADGSLSCDKESCSRKGARIMLHDEKSKTPNQVFLCDDLKSRQNIANRRVR